MRPIKPEVFERMVALRRDLHQHPELSWQEERTAARVSEVLQSLRVPFRRVAGTGIVADIPGPSGVPRIALRADMDALPIQEETGLPFTSVHDGVMHACGHDGHTSMLLGAAELLVAEPTLPAPMRLIFQPAEEVGGGARAMVQEGVLEDVAMVFGGHLDPRYLTGTLVITEGIVNASTDAFRIRITGRGAHGARPHEGIDAIVVGSAMVGQLQTIVAREVNPAHPAVVTVGRFVAGSAPNVLAETTELEGTIRAQDPAVREQILRALHRIAGACATSHGANAAVEITEGTPAVQNTKEMVALALDAGAALPMPPTVRPLRDANMGGEDFGWYLQHKPGCFIRFGAGTPGEESKPAHSSQFTFDEEALAIGAAWLHRVAITAGHRLRGGPGDGG